MAQVLWLLLRASGTKPYSSDLWGEMMMRQAARIAINRTVAGVHFPVDSVAGAVLGLNLGEYFVKRCKMEKPDTGWKFDGEDFKDSSGSATNLDFNWREYYDFASSSPGLSDSTPWVNREAFQNPIVDTDSEPLGWLWARAREEWHDIT